MKTSAAQPSLFDEDQPAKVQRLADWGTPEEHRRARALMLNLGERWGDRYAGQETMTEGEWRQRRKAAARRTFYGEDEARRAAQPMIAPHEEKAFRAGKTRSA